MTPRTPRRPSRPQREVADRDEEVPTKRTCGTMPVHERLLRTAPGYREARDAIENHAWRAMFSPMVGRTGCTMIPVVVHVVHNAAAQNISDAQIQSQINVLNDDFRATNADIGSVPAAFQPVIGDARLQFELASTDPAGNPTNGVTRTNTAVVGFTDDDAVKSAATGGADAWPRRPVPQHLGLSACGRPPRVRPVSWRTRRHRWRGHSPLGIRNDWDSDRSVRPRTHNDARDRALAQPAPHLGGRRLWLLGRRFRGGHSKPGRGEYRDAGLPHGQLRQRA